MFDWINTVLFYRIVPSYLCILQPVSKESWTCNSLNVFCLNMVLGLVEIKGSWHISLIRISCPCLSHILWEVLLPTLGGPLFQDYKMRCYHKTWKIQCPPYSWRLAWDPGSGMASPLCDRRLCTIPPLEKSSCLTCGDCRQTNCQGDFNTSLWSIIFFKQDLNWEK